MVSPPDQSLFATFLPLRRPVPAGFDISRTRLLPNPATPPGAHPRRRVNLFWVRYPAAELRLIASLLKPGGALFLFYEPPSPEQVGRLADVLTEVLARSGFMTETLTATADRPASLLCVKGVVGAADG